MQSSKCRFHKESNVWSIWYANATNATATDATAANAVRAQVLVACRRWVDVLSRQRAHFGCMVVEGVSGQRRAVVDVLGYHEMKDTIHSLLVSSAQAQAGQMYFFQILIYPSLFSPELPNWGHRWLVGWTSFAIVLFRIPILHSFLYMMNMISYVPRAFILSASTECSFYQLFQRVHGERFGSLKR